MVVILWTEKALNDLKLIHDFIAIDSPSYANRFVNRINEKIKLLYKFHLVGKIVPEINKPDIREILIKNYRIIYKINEDVVYISRIYHSKRLLTKL